LRVYLCVDHNIEIQVPDRIQTEHQLCTLERTWLRFVEWREGATIWQHIPIFEICGHHPKRGTMLDANEALRLELKLPQIPAYPFERRAR
jgi:hypothetical protein